MVYVVSKWSAIVTREESGGGFHIRLLSTSHMQVGTSNPCWPFVGTHVAPFLHSGAIFRQGFRWREHVRPENAEDVIGDK